MRSREASGFAVARRSVSCGSSLTKYTIGYEDDECWIVPVKDKDDKKGDYKRINKQNFSEAYLTDDQFQQIKAAQEGKK